LPYLKKNGITPLLLTGPVGLKLKDMKHFQSPSLLPSGFRCEIRHYLQRRNMKKWLYNIIQSIILLPLLPFYAIEKAVLGLDEGFSWFLCATMSGLRISKKYRPEVIYSTGGTTSAHLAAYFVSRFSSVPWIAEFQDPIVHDDWLGNSRELKFSTWLEKLICKKASAVVFMTEAAKNESIGRTELGVKGYCIYPGSTPEIFLKRDYQRKPTFHFAHFGSLSGSRNLEIFSKALKLFLDNEPELRDIVRVDLYGTCDDKTVTHVKNFPYEGLIKYHGRVARAESLKMMTMADCLLLIQNVQAFATLSIPSKVYEYLYTKRPVLGLIYKNPELDKMLLKHGHFVTDASDITSVLSGIKGIMSEYYFNQKEHNFIEPEWSINDAVSKLINISRGYSHD
jgi:glycosyltransferase involved in cell wall biosynthesis